MATLELVFRLETYNFEIVTWNMIFVWSLEIYLKLSFCVIRNVVIKRKIRWGSSWTVIFDKPHKHTVNPYKVHESSHLPAQAYIIRLVHFSMLFWREIVQIRQRAWNNNIRPSGSWYKFWGKIWTEHDVRPKISGDDEDGTPWHAVIILRVAASWFLCVAQGHQPDSGPPHSDMVWKGEWAAAFRRGMRRWERGWDRRASQHVTWLKAWYEKVR